MKEETLEILVLKAAIRRKEEELAVAEFTVDRLNKEKQQILSSIANVYLGEKQ